MEDTKDLEEQIELEEQLGAAEERNYQFRKKAQDEIRRFNKEQEKREKEAEAAQERIKEAQEDFKKSLRSTAEIWISFNFLNQIASTAAELVKTNSELHRMAVNAGKAGKGVKELKDAAADLRIKFGATAKDAQDVISTLAGGQYAGDIEKAAGASYQFARAFGITRGEVAKNTLELEKWGKVSASTATAMYADIMKVAQGHGLTKDAAEAVMHSTTELSGMMRAYGKTETQIRKMNSSMAKMASSMEKVGISAKTATQLVEKLLDPTLIEENISQYAALGISITDAISGNIDPSQIESGMKEVGQKIKDMGPIAGSAYAKAMGISYKDAIKAADLEQITEDVMTPEETAAESMKQMTDATKDMSEKMKDFQNKLEGILQKMGPLMMMLIGVVAPALVRLIKTKLKDGLIAGFKDGAKAGQKELDKLKAPSLEDQKSLMISEKTLKLENEKLLATEKGRRKYAANLELLKKQLQASKDKILAGREELSGINDKIKKQQESYATNLKMRDKLLEKQRSGKQLTLNEEVRLNHLNETLSNQEQGYVALLNRRKELNNSIIEEQTAHKEINDLIDEGNSKLKDAGGVGNTLFEQAKTAGESFGNKIKEDAANFLTIMKKGIKDVEMDDKEAKSFGGRIGRAIGAVKGLGETIGGKAGKLFGKAAESKLGNAAKKAGDFLGKKGGKLIDNIKGGAGFLTGMLSSLFKKKKKGGGDDKNDKGEKGAGIGGKIGKVAKVLGAALGIFGIIMTLLKKNEKIGPIIEKLMDTITGTLGKALDGLTPVINALAGIITNVVGALVPVIEGIITALMPVLNILINIISMVFTILQPILDIITEVVNIVVDVLMAVLKPLMPVIQILINVLKIPLKIISTILTALMPVIKVLLVPLKILCNILQLLFHAVAAVVKALTFGFVDLEEETKVQSENVEATKENTKATEKGPAQIKRTDDGGLSSSIAKKEEKKEEKKEGANTQNSATETKSNSDSNIGSEIKQGFDSFGSKLDSFINKLDSYMFMNTLLDKNKEKKEEKNIQQQQQAITMGVAKGIANAGEIPVKVSGGLGMNTFKFSLIG